MRRHLWWVLGLGLLVGGLVVALVTRVHTSDFGWFAYTPLGDDDPSLGTGALSATAMIVSPGQLLGVVAAVLGLVVIGTGTGYRLGRRRPPRPGP